MVLVSMPDPDNKGGGVLTLISNQDGFTEGDVKSICKLARTTKQELKNQPLQTKRARKKQIGHKGLGFKSVFTIAHGVHLFERLPLLSVEQARAGHRLRAGQRHSDAAAAR
jgi:HSP90 family molecular chaperone